uniref:AlNc14C15G1693 protein n=1 Tax=Albugo laibachii Nc14 TaxID=890382 RepID=F0W3Z4_9STRA|nr:AlNc14C15G1693 [Albugo laibachii Nc14]|eukprot:CCA15790.1 AlNc14C15G1693 [Albugo laibachii Nc14]
MLDQRTADRQEEQRQFSVIVAVEEDDDSTPSPIYDRFFIHGGAEAVRTMTNFSPREFNTLWSTMVEHITKYWNVGRGKRSQFAAKDVFFMMLLVLTNGGMWDMTARVFSVPTLTFIQTITKFLRVATPKLYDEQRQAQSPWTEVEVSVNHRGFAINCTDFAKGNVADIQIFQRNLEFHQKMRVKTEYDLAIEDRGPMKVQFSHEWTLLVDKGYQGLALQLRAIHPTRPPPRRRLSVDEERENDRISSDRVIVENYFGRLSTLWRICSERYRWGQDLYDEIFQACADYSLHVTEELLSNIAHNAEGHVVEKLEDVTAGRQKYEIKVLWRGLDDDENSSEPADNLLADVPVLMRKNFATTVEGLGVAVFEEGGAGDTPNIPATGGLDSQAQINRTI